MDLNTPVDLAVIGGSGFSEIAGLDIEDELSPHTRFGETSGPLVIGRLAGKRIVFLARHGVKHTLPPHLVNYRANIHALRQLGVDCVIAMNAVGGINPAMGPRHLCIPDQIIDYSWGREHTFSDGSEESVRHIDFSNPYDEEMRARLIAAAESVDMDFSPRATYGCTQGPRLETAAEIDRMERDGCDIVGMTGMPEAALARELDMRYASIALVANRAAGRGESTISLDAIYANLEKSLQSACYLLNEYVVSL